MSFIKTKLNRQDGLWLPDELAFARNKAELPPIAGGSSKTFVAYNGPAPAAAAPPRVTTGTAIKTMMQIATPSTTGIRVIEWGISFDAVSAIPVQCELIDAPVAATVTAYVAADIHKMNGPNDAASLMTLGTAASGYTATAEGTVTASRLGDYQSVSQSFSKQYPLGREFEVGTSRFLRVRVTATTTAVNATCYIVWEE